MTGGAWRAGGERPSRGEAPGGGAPTRPDRARRTALLLVLPLLVAASPADADALAGAGRAFADGVAHRDDAAAARRQFRDAAAGYDALWHRGHRTPALAVNRARAHRLAGDLPRALAALHAGLAVARFDRGLQQELDDARSAVGLPLDGPLAAQCRPPPVAGVSARMSPAEAWLIAGGAWAGACLAVARWAMTRNLRWLLAAGGCLVGLGVLGGLWWDDGRRRDPRSVVVVAVEAPLRGGNGTSYPGRLDRPLPPGAEARELSRRGGWVQVELPGGAAGWLPLRAVVPAE